MSERENTPNDLKLSDRVGLAGRVPPGETQENHAEVSTAPSEEARGMTARSSSLERMVRRLRSNSRKIWNKIDSFLWGGDYPGFTL